MNASSGPSSENQCEAGAPSPARFFGVATAYQSSAAIRTGVEVGLFTAIARGHVTSDAVAQACGISARGARILCDFMAATGLLLKSADRYELPADVATFLVQGSPAYMGDAVQFLQSESLRAGFDLLTEAVRRGGSALPGEASATETHEQWVLFAKHMGGLMTPLAKLTASAVRGITGGKAGKILDISASHGMYGLMAAEAHPGSTLVAQDGAEVLKVTAENARRLGLAERFQTLPGDAWEVDFGEGYQIVLLPNFLHHFDVPACERLLRKIHTAMAPGGVVAIVEFVPNEDRVSPPGAACFALVMLANTPHGDAYPLSELKGMLDRTGFRFARTIVPDAGDHTVVLATK